jgi:hypothetical protein
MVLCEVTAEGLRTKPKVPTRRVRRDAPPTFPAAGEATHLTSASQRAEDSARGTTQNLVRGTAPATDD